MNNSEISIESQKAKFSTIFRLNQQSNIDVGKYNFYNKNGLGEFINNNSLLKMDDQLAVSAEEITEEVLIYGTHGSVNFFSGFCAGLIPFGDLAYKPIEYKEGLYFSDELGEESFNKIANVTYETGSWTGFAMGLVADIVFDFLTAGTSTAATTSVRFVSVVDKTTDVANAVDKVGDAVKIVDKTSDAINLADKLSDSAKLADKVGDTVKIVDKTTDAANLTDKLGDSAKLADKVGDTVRSTDDYIFKIDLDDVPTAFRENYEQYFKSQTSSIKMNKNIGASLEDIFDTENYVIGIHKSGISNPDDIVSGGLRLTGDSSSGVAFNGIDLNNNIVFEQPFGAKDADFLRFCKNIEGSAGYKTVTGEGNAIIIKIPKEDFDDISKLTFFDGNQYVLKNDYIAGYVKTHMDDAGNVIFDDIIYKNGGVNSAQGIIDNVKNVKNITGDKTPISKRVSKVRQDLYKFQEKYLKDLGKTKQDIDNALNRIHFYEPDDFQKLLEKYKYPKSWVGFEKGGEVYLRTDASLGNMIHEVNHALGNVNNPHIEKYREINEAFTDLFVRKESDVINASGYFQNADALDDINRVFDSIGLKGADLKSYFGPNKTLYKTYLDNIVGEGYYDELANYMYKVIHETSDNARNAALANVRSLVNKFYNSVFPTFK